MEALSASAAIAPVAAALKFSQRLRPHPDNTFTPPPLNQRRLGSMQHHSGAMLFLLYSFILSSPSKFILFFPFFLSILSPPFSPYLSIYDYDYDFSCLLFLHDSNFPNFPFVILVFIYLFNCLQDEEQHLNLNPLLSCHPLLYSWSLHILMFRLSALAHRSAPSKYIQRYYLAGTLVVQPHTPTAR